jgi:hypothetical protein
MRRIDEKVRKKTTIAPELTFGNSKVDGGGKAFHDDGA